MAIRPARPEDVPVLLELIREFAASVGKAPVLDEAALATALFGPDPAGHATIAESGGEVAGYALWSWTFPSFAGGRGVWLEDLFVRERFRRGGVATELFDHVAGLAPARLEWSVFETNEPAMRFYRARGGARSEASGLWERPG
jgi:GNAT superfamily N-acetyltransferase